MYTGIGIGVVGLLIGYYIFVMEFISDFTSLGKTASVLIFVGLLVQYVEQLVLM